MAAYRSGRGIFAPGIVWDPREPLPHDIDPGHDAPPVFFNPQPVRVPIVLPTLTVQEYDRNVLPPLSISLDGCIVQDMATITATQVFWNDSPAVINKACYTFPLPTGCAITEFNCRIGKNRLLKGEVKPKIQAREEFQNHIRHTDTGAALLEQDTPEIFTASLGNIPEKTKVTVSLTFITFLKHHFHDRQGTTTLTIPTSIAQRYGSPPKGYSHASSNEVPEGLSLTMEIREHETIHSIKSNSHSISVNRHLGSRNARDFSDLAGGGSSVSVPTSTVELEAGSAFLEKDFVLDITTAPGESLVVEEPRAWIEEHPSLENHKALMLTIPPKFLNQPQNSSPKSEIIFLADRSGSMDDKIASLKSAMQFFLKGIPEGRKFNIWCFGSTHSSWCPNSVNYSEWSLEAALSFVERDFKADMGGTELLPAIQATVESRDKSLLTDIIVLTDGQTWRLDQTLEFIQSTRTSSQGAVRFFSLGIGDAVSHALVNGIAKSGGGYAEVVPSSTQGGWEDRVVSMEKAALTSDHLGPIHIDLEYQDGEGKQINLTLPVDQQSPMDISALNPFTRNRVLYLFDKPAHPPIIENLKITSHSGSGEMAIVIPVRSLDKGTMIHKLAARSLLEDLEQQSRNPGYYNRHTSAASAERIACKWSLVSKWTSFLLTEEQSPTQGGDLMGGIVTMRDASGEGLLRPRGPRYHSYSLLPSPVSPHSNRTSAIIQHSASVSLQDFTLLGEQGIMSYLLPRLSSGGLSHSDSFILQQSGCESPKPNRPPWPPDEFYDYPPQPYCTPEPPVIIDPIDNNIIRKLLQYQKFDGSFDFGVPDIAETSNLGRAIVDALKTILEDSDQPGLSWTVLCTAAVIVFLWRDYRPQQDLWDLMSSKATKYLEQKHNMGVENEIFEILRERLKDLRLPRDLVPDPSTYSYTALFHIMSSAIPTGPEPQKLYDEGNGSKKPDNKEKVSEKLDNEEEVSKKMDDEQKVERKRKRCEI